MALIFKLKDETFTKYVEIMPTPDGMVGWFDYGIDAESSSINKVEGASAGAFAGSGIIFDSNSVTLDQSSTRYFNTLLLETSSYTVIHAVKSSLFPRLLNTIEGTGSSASVSGLGSLDFRVNTGTATEVLSSVQVGTAGIDNAITVSSLLGTESTTSINQEVILSTGEVKSSGDSGGARDFVAAPYLIGRNTSGSGDLVIHETIIYDRVLTTDEINTVKFYLQNKYF